ncbi:hypothetical protein ABT143_26890 [Streptomyces sp. NPDC002033]|uniref:hypothetical protein n=1 Tax=unclassified Streptomyces TaxID=2593676 RepID=UPI003317024D
MEAAIRHETTYGLGFADIHAVRGEGCVHGLVVRAGVAAATAEYEGEVTAGFGERVPAAEAPAAVHHEHGHVTSTAVARACSKSEVMT